MKKEKTHWKKLTPSNYLGSWDVEGDVSVTIKSIKQERVKPSHSAPEEDCVIISVKEFDKPFIANKTNLKSIEKALKTPYIEEWGGGVITLFVKRIKAFGEEVDAIRVRSVAPKPKAKPTLSEDRFEKAVEGIKQGSVKVSQLDAYELTDSQKQALKEVSNA